MFGFMCSYTHIYQTYGGGEGITLEQNAILIRSEPKSASEKI